VNINEIIHPFVNFTAGIFKELLVSLLMQMSYENVTVKMLFFGKNKCCTFIKEGATIRGRE
jgi:hypothetical protein